MASSKLESLPLGDPKHAMIYRAFHLRQHSSTLVYALCVFTGALLLLALNHLPKPDMMLLLSTVSAAVSLALNIVLNIQVNTSARKRGTASKRLLGLIVGWLCATVIAMLPGSASQSSLLPTLIAVNCLYTMLPLALIWVAGTATFLSMVQTLSFVLLAPSNPPPTNQLVATFIIHAWSNFIGVYLYVAKTRLTKGSFISARNATAGRLEATEGRGQMGILLSSALPQHIVRAVQAHLGTDTPRLFMEHYENTSVLHATYCGLQLLLNQLNAQDSVRLLNEFNSRIDALVERYNFIQLPCRDHCIIVLAGVPCYKEDHALAMCLFARDMQTVFRSFAEATSTELQLKVGVASGSLTTGIMGAKKWHYEAIGAAVDTARELESQCPPGAILIAEVTQRLVSSDFALEHSAAGGYRLLHLLATSNIVCLPLPPTLLFHANQRRFSVVSFSQLVQRLLQSNMLAGAPARSDSVPNHTLFFNNTSGVLPKMGARRKPTSGSLFQPPVFHADEVCIDEADDLDEPGCEGLTNACLLSFHLSKLEQLYHSQRDVWFIPAIATNLLFLVFFGLYQAMVLPLLLSNLALILAALAVLVVALLVLYLNYFEFLTQFLTKTATGHILTTLLLIAITFTCCIVSLFSCPSFVESDTCHTINYAAVSIAMWMLASGAFIRFPSLYLLCVHLSCVFVYAVHVFGTHTDLYVNFSFQIGWRIEFDLLIGLGTLAALLYLQARSNERMLRSELVFTLRAEESSRQKEKFRLLNEQILFNMLPAHIAHNYALRREPYSHLCHTIGVVTMRFGQSDQDWQDEWGFDKLNRIVFALDQLLENEPRSSGNELIGVEKVGTTHDVYTAVVGVLPEISRNVHDAPITIGDLLVSLTTFALRAKEIAEDEKVDLAVGIDCGPALSMVLGGERPRYEVVGVPRIRATKLMKTAARFMAKHPGAAKQEKANGPGCCILISEEILLALRPRAGETFWLDDGRHPVNVAPGLAGHVLWSQPPPSSLPPVSTVRGANEEGEDEATSSHYARPATNTSTSKGTPCNEKEEFAISMGEGSTSDSGSDCGEVGGGGTSHQGRRYGGGLQIHCSPGASPPTERWTTSGRENDCENGQEGEESLAPSRVEIVMGAGFAEITQGPHKLELLSSVNTSIASGLCSIDVGVESDSELEWVTPAMLMRNAQNNLSKPKEAIQNQRMPQENGVYKGSRVREYSDFSEFEPQRGESRSLLSGGSSNVNLSKRVHRRRRFNFPRQHSKQRGPNNAGSQQSFLNPSGMTSRSSLDSRVLRSSYEGSLSALDRLNAAARRVDKMLLELAVIDDYPNAGRPPDSTRFPVLLSRGSKAKSISTSRSMQSLSSHLADLTAGQRKEETKPEENRALLNGLGSANQTDYEDADESIALSDTGDELDTRSESAISLSKLEELRMALRPTLANLRSYGMRLPPLLPFAQLTKQNLHHVGRKSAQRERNARGMIAGDEGAATSSDTAYLMARPPINFPSRLPENGGDDADVESSNYSSLASSRWNFVGHLRGGPPRWKQSIHSIGYDNEYEITSVASSLASSMGEGVHLLADHSSRPGQQQAGKSVGEHSNFPVVDADDVESEDASEMKGRFNEEKAEFPEAQFREQFEQLSRDIRKNFGEFPLASFSDSDNRRSES